MPSPSSPIVPHVSALRGRDLLSLGALSKQDIETLFATAAAIKTDVTPFRKSLDGRSVAMLFEKPSLRTRVSFEVGIHRLGGHAVYLDHSEQRLGERETIADYGHNLERWVDAIVARVYKQTILEGLSEASRVPVINALSDLHHPCQALADFLTLREKFSRRAWSDIRLAYVGDGNNVCHSLVELASILGVHVTVLTPPGRSPNVAIMKQCASFAARSGSTIRVTHDLGDVAGHDAVYTDVWVSMGQGSETDQVRELFRPFQVNAGLMAIASRGLGAGAKSLFMHCLPAHRGSEVTDEVIDAAESVVFDQAENRMHAQMALLVHMLCG